MAILCLYFLWIFMALNMNYWWMIWLMMELMNWFLMLLFFSFSMVSFLIWQTLSSIGMLLMMLVIKNSVITSIFLLFKTSLPPFHNIFWKMMKVWSNTSSFLFMFAHKVVFILIMNFMNLNEFYFLLLVPVFVLTNFWSFMNLKFFIWAITLLDSGWLFFSCYYKMKFMIYTMSVLLLMTLLITSLFKMKFIFLLMMVSMPPFSSFQIKMVIITNLFWLKTLLYLLFLVVSHLFYWFVGFFYLNMSVLATFKPQFINTSYLIWMNFFWLLFL